MIPKTFTLSNGKQIPTVGLGTWQSKTGEVATAVEAAIKAGYRHIDCAWGYGNEAEVGEGIRNSGVPREELFITSKLYEYHHDPQHVELAIKDTLKKLGTDYLDLYLMHWHIAFKIEAPPQGTLPLREHAEKMKVGGRWGLDEERTEKFMETYHALEKLQEKGLTKSIGISNFNINRTKKVLAECKIKPVANQVEVSLQCPQPELIKWLIQNDIRPEAYSPLGGTAGKELREDPVVAKIAEKHNVAGPAVLLSWLIKRGIVVLPKSVTPSRIEANLQTVDLSDEDVDAIEQLAEKFPPKRVCDQSPDVEPNHDIFQENDPKYSDKALYAQEQKA